MSFAKMITSFFDRNSNEQDKKEIAKPKFGIMFDIDGVLLRGKTPIAAAREAVQSLMDPTHRKFNIPCVFCTNAFGLPEVKAKTLSERLGAYIRPEQMVMSQTPLEMFHDFHDKWCLVSGPEHDGGSVEVAKQLGFRKIITIEDLRKAYPYLDWVDRERWPTNNVADATEFPAVEAVVLLGEPIRWETNLQLIIDVLITNGKPNQPAVEGTDQLPVLAVNMDLQWMAKARTPRFGHGAFLVCLENLYKKICGRDLVYTALIGKPSEITYEYSQKLIEELATEMDIPELETVYAIGDNPLTDIYGANMFNRFLKRKSEEIEKNRENYLLTPDSSPIAIRKPKENVEQFICQHNGTDSHIALHGDITNVRGIKKCVSFLVCTGVHKPSISSTTSSADGSISEESPPCFPGSLEHSLSPTPASLCPCGRNPVDHGHRDLPFTEEMTRADYVVYDVKNAIDKIFELEAFYPESP